MYAGLFYFSFQSTNDIQNNHFLKKTLNIFFPWKKDQFLTDSLLKYITRNVGGLHVNFLKTKPVKRVEIGECWVSENGQSAYYQNW